MIRGFTIDRDVQGFTALAETEAFVANSTEDVGQKADVVLGHALVLVDLVATFNRVIVATLVDGIFDLVVRRWADLGTLAVARQGHGSGSEEQSSGEELHFDELELKKRSEDFENDTA